MSSFDLVCFFSLYSKPRRFLTIALNCDRHYYLISSKNTSNKPYLTSCSVNSSTLCICSSSGIISSRFKSTNSAMIVIYCIRMKCINYFQIRENYFQIRENDNTRALQAWNTSSATVSKTFGKSMPHRFSSIRFVPQFTVDGFF